MLDYKTGLPEVMELKEEREPDQSYAKRIKDRVGKNDLFIFDQGYAVTPTFKEIEQQGGYFISKLNIWSVNLYTESEGKYKRIDVLKMLNKLDEGIEKVTQIECYVGNKDTKIKVRFFAHRVRQSIADQRRRRLYKKARREGRKPSKAALQLCNWNLIISNIEKKKRISYSHIVGFYKIRWNIEIFFKQLKSILNINKTATKTNGYRFTTEIIGKFILAIFISYCYSIARKNSWDESGIEISIEKTVKHFKRHVWELIEKIKRGLKHVIKFIKGLIRKIIHRCQKYRQRSRQNSLDMLIEGRICKGVEYVKLPRTKLIKFVS